MSYLFQISFYAYFFCLLLGGITSVFHHNCIIYFFPFGTHCTITVFGLCFFRISNQSKGAKIQEVRRYPNLSPFIKPNLISLAPYFSFRLHSVLYSIYCLEDFEILLKTFFLVF